MFLKKLKTIVKAVGAVISELLRFVWIYIFRPILRKMGILVPKDTQAANREHWDER